MMVVDKLIAALNSMLPIQIQYGGTAGPGTFAARIGRQSLSMAALVSIPVLQYYG
jgi:hypothetical protein